MKKQNSITISKIDLVIVVVSFLIFLLLVLTSTSKAMECKSEVIMTSQGTEVCWVCISNGEIVSIQCYK